MCLSVIAGPEYLGYTTSMCIVTSMFIPARDLQAFGSAASLSLRWRWFHSHLPTYPGVVSLGQWLVGSPGCVSLSSSSDLCIHWNTDPGISTSLQEEPPIPVVCCWKWSVLSTGGDAWICWDEENSE